ncbi:hypothetical protein KEM55_009380, partial [Ascosphaera atra]
MVQNNVQQSKELSDLLARFLSQTANDYEASDVPQKEMPEPFIKPLREEPEQPGPKIAVAGGDSPSPPRDTRFFDGHRLDRTDGPNVSDEKSDGEANAMEEPGAPNAVVAPEPAMTLAPPAPAIDASSSLHPSPTPAINPSTHSPVTPEVVACPVFD